MKKATLLLILLFTFSLAFSAESIVLGVRQTTTGFQGVKATLKVTVEETSEGAGHVYIDTLPLTEIDTQASARLAKEVACETLNVNCTDKNFFYVIRGEFPMIGGPSAGAAMTLLTMSELSGLTPNENVAITGTINPDGSVGSIGGVLEKAVTASQAGITTFLVPQAQLDEVGNYTFQNNMSVVGVFTVREAYSYFTNVNFEKLDDIIYFDEFNEFMEPMSEELIVYSEDLYDEMLKQYEASNLSQTNKELVEFLINNSFVQKEEMEFLFANNSFYSAASYAVGLSINSLYTTYLINYFSTNKTEYVNSLFSFSDNELNRVYDLINQNFTINHINDLEAINIAIDRYFEAEQIYGQAKSYYQANNTPSTLYNLAFTFVRLKTCTTWLMLKDEFEDDLDIKFSQDLLKDLALNRIESTDNMILYAESAFVSVYTQNANEHLDSSRKAYDEGNYIYSLFESLKALSNANLAMQLSAVSLEEVGDKIQLAKTQARQNINLAQTNGLMPILALSYYEYSETFEEDNPAQALIFLEYSKQFSLLSTQMVHNIDLNAVESLFEISSPREVGKQLTIILLGVIMGIGLTFIILFRLLK